MRGEIPALGLRADIKMSDYYRLFNTSGHLSFGADFYGLGSSWLNATA